jgi:hypothetical protein
MKLTFTLSYTNSDYGRELVEIVLKNVKACGMGKIFTQIELLEVCKNAAKIAGLDYRPDVPLKIMAQIDSSSNYVCDRFEKLQSMKLYKNRNTKGKYVSNFNCKLSNIYCKYPSK